MLEVTTLMLLHSQVWHSGQRTQSVKVQHSHYFIVDSQTGLIFSLCGNNYLALCPLKLPHKSSWLQEAVVHDFPDDIGGSSAFRFLSHCSNCLPRACSFTIMSRMSDVRMSCCFASVVAAFHSLLDTCCVLHDMQLNKSLCELTKVPCRWKSGSGMIIQCLEVPQSVNLDPAHSLESLWMNLEGKTCARHIKTHFCGQYRVTHCVTEFTEGSQWYSIQIRVIIVFTFDHRVRSFAH